MTSISLPLRDATGKERGAFVVSELPGGARFATGDVRALREAQRYRYELAGVHEVSQMEPAELFDADDESRLTGRINPGQSVGQLIVVVHSDDDVAASAAIEVVPTKLEQADEYRRMLSDIMTHAAEAVLQGFAPTVLNAATSTAASNLLYQRFAVLESRLRSDDFAAAVGRIVADPHIEWLTIAEQRPPGTAYPTGSAFGRALAAPGPRRAWLTDRGRPALASMPTMLERSRYETTFDTAPNRFIKYALEAWGALAQQLHDTLVRDETTPPPGPVRRGLRATDEVIEILDEVLSRPLFRQVGSLDRFPASNQVLLKREGYRQLLHIFALVEAGLDLPWESDADDVYSPSLRNVAALYEIWSYLTLVDIVGALCGDQKAPEAFAPSPSGLSLRLKAGTDSALTWKTTRGGRPLEVQLMFNRQFATAHGSWTAPMRPDCSILIRPLAATPREAVTSLDVWVHFDAKYRVDGGLPFDLKAEEDDEPLSRGTAKRADLLKMHAYRDAIHSTAGAYVLYPGDQTVDQRQFNETLPGLGAFPLRPNVEGTIGVDAIRGFLANVLDHVAEQATQHERDRFWRGQIYAAPVQEHATRSPVPFLDRPPADTDILVGYVRNPAHRAWIERTHSYNVRADDRSGALHLGSRELGAQLVLLYEGRGDEFSVVQLAQAGEWRAATRVDLENTGYPNPRGNLYLVTSLALLPSPPDWLTKTGLEKLRPANSPSGAPFAVTWFDLIASVR